MLIDKLDAILRLNGKNISGFAKDNNIAQANLSNKKKRNSYYLKEAVMIADYTNTKLAFVDESGKPLVVFDMDDIKSNQE